MAGKGCADMRAGELRHRVVLQAKTITRDDYGSPSPSYRSLATIWAGVEDLTGREFWEASKINSEVTSRIKIRYRAGIRPDMRIIFSSRTFDILAVLDPEGRRTELHLMCRELVM